MVKYVLFQAEVFLINFCKLENINPSEFSYITSKRDIEELSLMNEDDYDLYVIDYKHDEITSPTNINELFSRRRNKEPVNYRFETFLDEIIRLKIEYRYIEMENTPWYSIEAGKGIRQ